jgi:tRNA pseudouridine32 synthase/23S rRNA pseudouridine746 synthase
VDWPALRSGRVLLEDEAVLVLDKPAGVSVTGERHETDVVRLAADAGEVLLPAHRIDKVTSGVVLFARSIEVHSSLTRQFTKRTVDKDYLVVARSAGLPERGTIDLPLGVGRKGRIRVAAPREAIALDPATNRWSVPERAVRTDRRAYPSVTTFVRLWEHGDHSVLLVRPLTGRRHQIRVHLAWIGHAIAGDPLFERDPAGRTCLHAWRLAFDASWSDGRRIAVEAPPGADLWSPLDRTGADPDALLARARAAVRRSGGG